MRNFKKHCCLVAVAISLMIAVPARTLAAEEIAFSGWTHQRFSLLGGNTWRQQGDELSVESDGSVSLLWQALPEGFRLAQTASWTWSVEQGVPPTDLSQKGGDDRNLSLYAIFAPPEAAATAESQGIRTLLENPDVRVLMYVWGGAHERGDLLSSPYLGARGKTIVLRPAGDGRFDEQVDLRADLERAFGVADFALVGLAVSADSDDTGSAIRASIGPLQMSD
jgi:hypothetical protein